jgi:hypothetical protein
MCIAIVLLTVTLPIGGCKQEKPTNAALDARSQKLDCAVYGHNWQFDEAVPRTHFFWFKCARPGCWNYNLVAENAMTDAEWRMVELKSGLRRPEPPKEVEKPQAKQICPDGTHDWEWTACEIQGDRLTWEFVCRRCQKWIICGKSVMTPNLWEIVEKAITQEDFRWVYRARTELSSEFRHETLDNLEKRTCMRDERERDMYVSISSIWAAAKELGTLERSRDSEPTKWTVTLNTVSPERLEAWLKRALEITHKKQMEDCIKREDSNDLRELNKDAIPN